MTRPWRLGGHAEAQPGPLVTVWEFDPGEEADVDGRRRSDRLVGSLLRRDAERAVVGVNTVLVKGRALGGW